MTARRFSANILIMFAALWCGAGESSKGKLLTLPLNDFEKGAQGLFQYGNGEAKFTDLCRSTEQVHDGKASLQLKWNFGKNPKNGDFAGLGITHKVPGTPRAFNCWVYADRPNLNLVARYSDASGETFQRDVCKIDWTGWKKVVIPTDATPGHWGGDNNGVINLPLTLDSLLFAWSTDGKAVGTVYLDDLSVDTVIDERNPVGAVSLNYASPIYLQLDGNNQLKFTVKCNYPVKIPFFTAVAKIFAAEGKNSWSSEEKKLATDAKEISFNLTARKVGKARIEVKLLTPDGQCMETAVVNDLTVLPEIATGKPEPESIFGICQKSPDCSALGSVGMKWIRIDFDYTPPEWFPETTFEQSAAEFKKTVDSATANKITTLAILNPRRFLLTCQPGGAVTATQSSLNSFAHGSYQAAGAKEKMPTLIQWGDWVYRVVSTFKGQIKYWEIANEPDLATSPQQYTALNNIAYIMAKKADPDCKVGSFSTAGINFTFIEECLKAGMTNYFDFVSIHPYQWCHSFNPSLMQNQLKGLETLLQKYNCNRPLWITEFGWPSQPQGGVSQPLQAALLAQLLLTGAALEKYKIFWYCSGDWPGAPTDQEANFGIFDGAGRPKPAFYSYYTIARLLAGARHLEELELPQGIHGHRYLLEEGKMAIGVWSDKKGKNTITLKLTGVSGNKAILQQTDLNAKAIAVKKREVEIDADIAPVLIIYPTKQQPVLKAKPIFTLPPSSKNELFAVCPGLPKISPGEQLTLPFSIINQTGNTVKAKLSVKLPSGWNMEKNTEITAAAGTETIGMLKVNVPGDAVPGKQQIELSFASGSRIMPEVEVSNPLLLDIDPIAVPFSGQITLSGNAVNVSNIRSQGTLTVKVGGGAADIPINVPPRSQKRWETTVNINDPTADSVWIAGTINNKPYGTMNKIDSIYIPRTTTPLNIDGDWNKWKHVGAFHLGRVDQAKPLANWWLDEKDLSGEIKLQWDEQYLYLAAKVRDNVHFQPSVEGGTWMGDGFQLGFGVNGQYAYELLLADTAAGGQLYQLKSLSGQVGFLPGGKAVTKNIGNETFYEAAIPWQSIPGVMPANGDRIRFNFILNENDGAGRKGWLECRPGIGSTKAVDDNYQWLLGH